MRKLHLYIETSVWSHWYADDTPERRDETRAFLRRCAAAPHDVVLYISRAVLDELAATPGERGEQLLGLVTEFDPVVVESSSEADDLAAAYLSHGAMPPGSLVDAMHAALATVHGVDVLVSWNCRHLANLSRRRKINAVNAVMGYAGNLDILTPMEIFEDAHQ